MEFLLVGFGGFFGAISRYLVYQVEKKYFLLYFPWATLFVNALGCLLAGIALGFLHKNAPVNQSSLGLFLTIGFLGSFTTFSTLGIESVRLINSNHWGVLFSSLATNLGLGILCVYLGIWVGTKLLAYS